jgi:V/A-type H+-transporting ATPase subunit E
MSIENIIERILSDAQKDAEEILAEAVKEKEAVLMKARREAENIEKEVKVNSVKDSVIHKERRISVAELEARKLTLAAKQQAISKCFDKALSELSRMDAGKYEKFLKDAVKSTGMNDGELLFNEADRKAVGQKVVKDINTEGKRMVLSEETIDNKGGFILRKGHVIVDATLETILNSVKETVTPEVATILFE